jgi:hypothetical protein
MQGQPLAGTDSATDSKLNILDQYQWIPVAAAVVVGIVSPGLPDGQTQQATRFVALLLLIVVGARQLYKHVAAGRAASAPPPQAVAPPRPALREFAPFVEADAPLPGRSVEAGELNTRVTSSSARVWLVIGDASVGKTSFMGAGVLPLLRKNELVQPVLLSLDGADDPRDVLARTLQVGDADVVARLRQMAQRPGGTAASIILILDQFERYAAASRGTQSWLDFLAWVKDCLDAKDLPVSIFFVMRSTGHRATIDDLEQALSNGDEAPERYVVDDMPTGRARALLAELWRHDAVSFESGLVPRIVNDLRRHGRVAVADLHAVAWRLQHDSDVTLDAYLDKGKAQAIVADAYRSQLDAFAEPRIAREVIALLLPGRMQRAPSTTTLDQLVPKLERSGFGTSDQVRPKCDRVLGRLVREAILDRCDDGTYQIARPSLNDYLRRALGNPPGRLEYVRRRADRFLARYGLAALTAVATVIVLGAFGLPVATRVAPYSLGELPQWRQPGGWSLAGFDASGTLLAAQAGSSVLVWNLNNLSAPPTPLALQDSGANTVPATSPNSLEPFEFTFDSHDGQHFLYMVGVDNSPGDPHWQVDQWNLDDPNRTLSVKRGGLRTLDGGACPATTATFKPSIRKLALGYVGSGCAMTNVPDRHGAAPSFIELVDVDAPDALRTPLVDPGDPRCEGLELQGLNFASDDDPLVAVYACIGKDTTTNAERPWRDTLPLTFLPLDFVQGTVRRVLIKEIGGVSRVVVTSPVDSICSCVKTQLWDINDHGRPLATFDADPNALVAVSPNTHVVGPDRNKDASMSLFRMATFIGPLPWPLPDVLVGPPSATSAAYEVGGWTAVALPGPQQSVH